MLEKLLHLLLEGGIQTPESLARQLDVSVDMVERMLDDLVRLGYLREVPQACGPTCAGCPYASACAVSARQHIWALTDKARTLIRT